jgi:hypothetical protein
MADNKLRVIQTENVKGNTSLINCGEESLIIHNSSSGHGVYLGNNTGTPVQIAGDPVSDLNVSGESRFSGMAHFDGNVHLCNNGDYIGGRIYFGDSVDMDENSANVYIGEDDDDELTLSATEAININSGNVIKFEGPNLTAAIRGGDISLTVDEGDLSLNSRQKVIINSDGDVNIDADTVNIVSATEINFVTNNGLLWNGGTIINEDNINRFNAGSASKLYTARKLWGQSFDGTADVSGDITATAYYTSSDERLKTFGDDIEVDFEKLAKLRKSYFNFNDDPDKQHLGVSAQEVKEIYPEIVNTDDNGYLSVDYAKLSVVALKAVDNLHERITRLEKLLIDKE